MHNNGVGNQFFGPVPADLHGSSISVVMHNSISALEDFEDSGHFLHCDGTTRHVSRSGVKCGPLAGAASTVAHSVCNSSIIP